MDVMTLPASSAGDRPNLGSGPATSVPPANRRPVRFFVFSPWADRLRDGADYLQELPRLEVARRVSNPADAKLIQMARLDCDWHGENIRALGAARGEGLEFLPVQALGKAGLADLLGADKPLHEDWWLVLTGQHPQMLAGTIGKVLALLARKGIRTLYYAFDEASRTMPAFAEIAPHLAVLIHDESPLAPAAQAGLAPNCRIIHRSWVANLAPFATPFDEAPEDKVVFLGSKLGLTPHRQRQIDYLGQRFGARFTAICDHSLAVADKAKLARFKVGLCPEGRKFTTPAMRFTHTDRPFWAGALGLVPVSEDSREGGRLELLHRENLIIRYPHGDLAALGEACERALALDSPSRRRIYDHFNRHETIGAVVVAALQSLTPTAI